MQKQMMMMKKQLEEKNSLSPSNYTSTEQSREISIEDKPKTNASLSEVDLFSQSNTSSKEFPKSPVKTNPFTDGIDRKVQFPTAKIFYDTPNFGPALSNKVTRSLGDNEKTQLLKELSKKDKEKKENEGLSAIQITARDLECSSDEDVDEEGNRITLSKYSDYGNEIKRQLSRKAHQPQNLEQNQRARKQLTTSVNSNTNALLKKSNPTTVHGFNDLQVS